MSQLKSIDRSATFSFCHNAPFMAAGSVAGAIDLSFSTSSQLEIFSLDFGSPDRDLKLAGAAVQAPERFARLAWGAPGADRATYPYGLLAGGLSDGSVCIWNPARIIGASKGSDARGTMLCRLQKHQGAVRGLEFNPFSPNLLASGASDGELCIWDVGNPAQPSLYPAMQGAGATASQDITCLAWNRKVQHIMGTAFSGGTVVVWDLKKQKPVISFKDPARRRYSAVTWNPEVATQLVVASDDDASPALQLWDLRNSVSPLMELHGHTKGVLSLSWCPQDAAFLLSSGKDGRTIVWDVPSGQMHSELPPGPNWKFDVQFAPGQRAAGVFGGATFEGKLTLHSMGACHPPAADESGYAPPHSAKPPAWLRRPAGATFGFGGKLVKFVNSKRQLPTGEVAETATMVVQQVVVEASTPEISPELEAVIRSADRNALRALCETRAGAAASAQEAETWAFLQTHYEADGRAHLLERLGMADALAKPPPPAEEEAPAEGGEAAAAAAAASLAGLSLEQAAQAQALQLLSNPADDGSAFFAQSPVDGDAFFNNLNTPREGALSPTKPEGGAAAAAAAAAAVTSPAAPKSPAARAIQDGVPGEGEDEIHACLLVGNYDGAVEACLKAGRHADALVAASLIGGEQWERARREYMFAHPRPYMRVVHAALSGDWAGFVAARPAAAWRQTLAALLTTAPYDQFETLVAALANKLAAAGAAHAATLCHVCAGDVEGAVRLWSRTAGADASAEVKAAVMEKAVVLGMGVDRAGSSSALGDLLARHSEALAANGRLAAAYDLLSLVPGDGSTAGTAAVLRDRLYRSGGVPQAAAPAPPPFPFSQEAAVPSTAAVAPMSAGPTSGWGSVAGFQQQQPVSSGGYGSYTAPPPTSYQQQQLSPKMPAVNGYGSGAYGAPPPPTTFQPAAAPPPLQSQPSLSAPVVFQPVAPGYGGMPPPPPTAPPPGPPTGGSYPSQQQQQSPHRAPAAPAPMVYQNAPGPAPAPTAPMASQWSAGSAAIPSPRTMSGPPMGQQPAVFQPAAAPPVGAPPPQLAGPPPATFQPAPPPQQQQQPVMQMQAAAAAPAVFQPQQQHAMYGAMTGGLAPVIAPPAPPSPPPPPRGPPADVAILTVDTSKVAGELQPVAATLKGLYQACEAVAGANPTKRRELDDASRKLGALLWRLNEGEVSPSVTGKLQQLSAALDAGDFGGAGHVQVQLTTADWEECSSWLTALKRLIKVRQMG